MRQRTEPRWDATADTATAQSSSRHGGSDPVVFVGDNNEVRGELYGYWLGDNYDVEKTTSREQVSSLVDSSVVVAVLSTRFLDSEPRSVIDPINERAPFCRIVEISNARGWIIDPDGVGDAVLQEPVSKAEFRSTVDHQARQALYDRTLNAFFTCSEHLASLEVSNSAETPDHEEEYRILSAEIGRLRNRLASLAASMDSADFESILESFRNRPKKRAVASSNTEGAKYHPRNCHECGQKWDENDGEWGFDRLGSYTWKCTRCGNIEHKPQSSNRRIARR